MGATPHEDDGYARRPDDHLVEPFFGGLLDESASAGEAGGAGPRSDPEPEPTAATRRWWQRLRALWNRPRG